MYLVNRPQSIASFEAHASQISIVAPQVFTMDTEGFVMGEVPAAVLETAAHNHVAVMPLVTNRGFDQPLMRTVLDDPVARARAIRYLLFYALRDGYIGFQFDYENIHYTYRDKFTEFFREAARSFHRHGLLLSAAVVGKYSDDSNAASPGGYENWSGVYDYRALGRAADFLSIMAYPQHAGFSGPGPLAGVPWVRQIADYTIARMPRGKISLGIPLYGVQWTSVQPEPVISTPVVQENSGQPTRKWKAQSTPYSSVAPLFTTNVPAWDAEEQAHHLTIDQDQSEIWYEDADSLRPKLELATGKRFMGVSGWVLGHEDPQFWSLLERDYIVRRLRSHLLSGPLDQRARAAARKLRLQKKPRGWIWPATQSLQVYRPTARRRD